MMKRFKFGLVGLLFGLFWSIGFSNAFDIIPLDVRAYGLCSNGCTYSLSSGDCFYFSDSATSNCGMKMTVYNSDDEVIYTGNTTVYRAIFCMNESGYVKNNYTSSCTLNVMHNFLENNCPSCPECETCPEINTGDILSGSCDTNYCVENDLCPIPSNFSQLFINEIEHQSAPLINISIPEEYSWDSSVDSGQFDLVISGQNVDYEYIDGVIRTQKFAPDEEDFNNIITQVVPLLIPGLVIILFIWFIFRFIKKIF